MLSRRELDRLMRTCEPRPPVQINEVVAEVRAEAYSALTLCWPVAMRVGFLDFPSAGRSRWEVPEVHSAQRAMLAIDRMHREAHRQMQAIRQRKKPNGHHPTRTSA